LATPNVIDETVNKDTASMTISGAGVFVMLRWDANATPLSARWRVINGGLLRQLTATNYRMLASDSNGGQGGFVLGNNQMPGRNGTGAIAGMNPYNVLHNLYENGVTQVGNTSGSPLAYDGLNVTSWNQCWFHRMSVAPPFVVIRGLLKSVSVDFVPVKVLENASINPVVFRHLDAGVASGNKIRCPNGVDYPLHGGTSVLAAYNYGDNVWQLVATQPPDKEKFTTVTLSINQDNWQPGGAGGWESIQVLRIDCTADRDVTGFVRSAFSLFNVSEMYRRKLINVGGFNITLKHLVTSSANNQLLNNTGADIVLAPNASIDMLYDPIDLKWRVGV
jgi:hypothetical protein